MIDQERVKVNFFIHYEIDDETIKTVLRLDEYDGDDDGSWVLLEAAVRMKRRCQRRALWRWKLRPWR